VCEIDEVNAGHAGCPSQRAGRSDQTVGRVEHENIVRVEHRIQHVPGWKFMHALQHGDPVGRIAIEMHETFRTGDFRHRDGGVKRVAAGNAVGHLELMRAKTDPVGAVPDAGACTPPAYCTAPSRFSIPTMLSGGSENTWATRKVSGWR